MPYLHKFEVRSVKHGTYGAVRGCQMLQLVTVLVLHCQADRIVTFSRTAAILNFATQLEMKIFVVKWLFGRYFRVFGKMDGAVLPNSGI